MTSKAQKNRFIRSADDHQRAIVRLLQENATAHRLARTFADWIEICAICLANLDLRAASRREERYLQIIKAYSREELDRFAQAFAHLQMAYEIRFSDAPADSKAPYCVDFADILGRLYMSLDLGNDQTGQFFTPYEVSLLMARIGMQGVGDRIEEQGFVRLQEPAVGAGGMVIASAQAMLEEGFDYQRTLHVTAIDVDPTCVHMAFVQFAMLSIPAVVVQGSSLQLEVQDQWFTPAHIIGGWGARLRAAQRELERHTEPVEKQSPPPTPHSPAVQAMGSAATAQLPLF
ncbi:N-6 DNA methylase [Achromobacter aloeverae]